MLSRATHQPLSNARAGPRVHISVAEVHWWLLMLSGQCCRSGRLHSACGWEQHSCVECSRSVLFVMFGHASVDECLELSGRCARFASGPSRHKRRSTALRQEKRHLHFGMGCQSNDLNLAYTRPDLALFLEWRRWPRHNRVHGVGMGHRMPGAWRVQQAELPNTRRACTGGCCVYVHLAANAAAEKPL
jgi:hypothetical protein